MFKFASLPSQMFWGAFLPTIAAFAAGGPTEADAQAPPSIPDFYSDGISWSGGNGLEFIPVPGSPPAVTTDPENPYINNAINRVTGEQQTYHIADLTNPNLRSLRTITLFYSVRPSMLPAATFHG